MARVRLQHCTASRCKPSGPRATRSLFLVLLTCHSPKSRQPLRTGIQQGTLHSSQTFVVTPLRVLRPSQPRGRFEQICGIGSLTAPRVVQQLMAIQAVNPVFDGRGPLGQLRSCASRKKQETDSKGCAKHARLHVTIIALKTIARINQDKHNLVSYFGAQCVKSDSQTSMELTSGFIGG
ncbi:hypothetical protein F5X99DRAFT_372156 [Biscogniauxia marginata]|nr:hypothetical protein F5X99DRAFT_372156 [Biscogniauxia marginata]